MGLFDGIGAVLNAGVSLYEGHQNRKMQRESIKSAERNNPMRLMDEMSDGGYSDYLKNFAFRSPSDQGKMSRDMLDSEFPELNAWEKAGSSSAGIAGAVGQNANAAAQQGAASKSQAVMQGRQIAAQLEAKNMDNKTQLMTSAINAATSLKTTEMNNAASKSNTQLQTDTAKRNVDAQLQPVLQKLPEQVRQLNISNNTSLLNQAVIADKVTSLVTNGLQNEGIQLDVENKKILNEKLRQDVVNAKESKSTIGKMVSDFSHTVSETIDWSKDRLRNAKPQDDISYDVKRLLGAGQSMQGKEGVNGATSDKRKNNVRFYDQSKYVKSLH